MNKQIRQWERPKTTRRYIHPPKAERILTLWADAKIMLGEVQINPGPEGKPYEEEICHGIWFIYGDEQISDFKTVKNYITEDGVPVHTIENKFGKLTANIEVLSNIDRKCTGFAKVTLKNTTDASVNEKFGFLLRTDLEQKLIFGAPDVYYPYESNLAVWKESESTWKKENSNLFSDGNRFIGVYGADLNWDNNKGVASIDAQLSAGEEITFYLSIGIGEYADFNYEEEKEKCEKWWRSELNKINNLPDFITNSPEKVKMVKHLTAQILQCFCYPIGETLLLSRQGGLQRFIWPFEALFAMEGINRIGDFDEYVEETIACYFDRLQSDEGEIVPLGNHWAMVTGNVLYSFAAQCEKNKDFYYKYRDKAMKAFEWIRSTRASSANIEGCAPGLFPPLRSSDCEYVFQALFFTDCRIIFDLKRFVDLVESFNDPRADEVRAEYEDYLSVFKTHADYLIKEAEDKDEIRHTIYVPTTIADERMFSFQPTMSFIARLLDIKNEDVEKIINYGRKRGFMDVNGLYSKMKDGREPSEYNLVDEDGVTRVWYTSLWDTEWFYVFLKMGDRNRAKEIMEAMVKYSMTDELHMIERFHPRNPYFCPWSPNASASGRFIQMLLDFGE